mgnify:CR=1 FL=1
MKMVLQFGGDADRTAPRRHTDDTEMAVSVNERLGKMRLDEPGRAGSNICRADGSCARLWTQRAEGLLTFVRQGRPWRALALAAMGGEGAFGNRAAMRVALLGAFSPTTSPPRTPGRCAVSDQLHGPPVPDSLQCWSVYG